MKYSKLNQIVVDQIDQLKKQGGISLTCHRCDYEWKYKGINPYWASCLFCKATVSVYRKRMEGVKK
jgi:hypothetical protein